MERIITCSIVKAKLEFVYWDLIWRWVIIFYNISKNDVLTFKYSTENKSSGKRVAIKSVPVRETRMIDSFQDH